MTMNETEHCCMTDGEKRLLRLLIIPWGSRPVGLPLNHGPFNARTGETSPQSFSGPQNFICNLNLKHSVLKSHIKGLFDRSDRAKAWNKMTNYDRWLVGHVSYRLIGLHNVELLLFFLHLNEVFFAKKAEMVNQCFGCPAIKMAGGL